MAAPTASGSTGGGGGSAGQDELQLHVTLMSQPSRAVVIFCRCNDIPHKIHKVDLAAGQHRSTEFKAINPLGLVPAMVDGDFKLAESHAILRYLVATRNCAQHWYPTHPEARARVDMVLDWHHANLRRGTTGLVVQKVMGPVLGITPVPALEDDVRATLHAALATLETLFLAPQDQGQQQQQHGGASVGPFLLGFSKPTLADLSLACELQQLVLLGPKERDALLERIPKVREWSARVASELSPHFDEAHKVLHGFAAKLYPSE